jgi:hypothetical protein
MQPTQLSAHTNNRRRRRRKWGRKGGRGGGGGEEEDCQVKCKDPVKSLTVVTEYVNMLNKQRNWGKANKRKKRILGYRIKNPLHPSFSCCRQNLSQHCPLQNECLWTTSTSYA